VPDGMSITESPFRIIRVRTGLISSVPAKPDKPIADSKNKVKNTPVFIFKLLLKNMQKDEIN
jgi:hypothetical protein